MMRAHPSLDDQEKFGNENKVQQTEDNPNSELSRRKFIEILCASTASATFIACFGKKNEERKRSYPQDDLRRNTPIDASTLDVSPKKKSYSDAGQTDIQDSGTDKVKKVPEYAEAQEIIQRATFEKGSFEKLSKVFKDKILKERFGKAYYFKLNGEICHEVTLPKKGDLITWLNGKKEKIPESWELHTQSKYWNDQRKQDWHNLQRKKCSPKEGIVLPRDIEKLGYPIVSVPYTGHKTHEGDSYEEIAKSRLNKRLRDSRYFDGKRKTITQAISIISTEYGIPSDLVLGIGGQESTYYKKRLSDKGAYGIFQLREGAFNKSKEFLLDNPSFREGKIKEKHPTSNRFVQVELFCAYYRYLKSYLKKDLSALEKRLTKLDKDFDINTVKDIFLATAYNAGPFRMKNCLKRFNKLNDDQIKKIIGKPPYGKNVLLGVLANSFGAKNKVGKDVFFYAAKVEGWKELLKDELEKEEDDESYEKYKESVIPAAKKSLTKKFNYIKEKDHDFRRFTRKEYKTVRGSKVKMPGQISLLRSKFQEFIPKKFFKARSGKLLRASTRRRRIKRCVRRRNCFSYLKERQIKWKKRQLKAGNLIKMDENNSKNPYFCQQVGKNSGVNNSENSLYMNKEFKPLLKALVELVNFQIDEFNKNPDGFGVNALKEVKIPHISAIKISGAFRSIYHQYKGLKQRSRTKDFSSHLTGQALDIGALTPRVSQAEIVRFKEPFIVNGNEKIPAGSKLSASGFGEQTRLVISKMIGRALMSMMAPLKKKGIKLLPLWERSPQNWHVTIGRKK